MPGSTAAVSPSVPGWYGKLPSLGDFASRRIALDGVEVWDHWLASGMQALRDARPDKWLQAYLDSPMWRFIAMPQALPECFGDQMWAGVLMPSVDKVGRYFPFLLLTRLGRVPASTRQMQMLWHWLARLEELAADALHDDWSIARLEDELSRLQSLDFLSGLLIPLDRPYEPGSAILAAGHERLDAAAIIDAEAQALWAESNKGLIFWQGGGADGAGPLLISRGLPADVGVLLGARSNDLR